MNWVQAFRIFRTPQRVFKYTQQFSQVNVILSTHFIRALSIQMTNEKIEIEFSVSSDLENEFT